jgi:SHS family lactate transporter-like MFS transporter
MGELHLDAQTTFLHVILFNLGMLVGVIAAGVVANRWGVIVALVAPALAMVPALPLYVGWVHGMLGVGAFLGGALGVGYSGVTPVLTTSLFPEHVRARAIGVVYHVGALIAAFVPWTIAEVSTTTGTSLSTVVAIVVGIGLVAMSVSVILLRRSIVPAQLRVSRPALTTPVTNNVFAIEGELEIARRDQALQRTFELRG